VFGNGNCLFTAGLYGTQEHHLDLRAKAAIEIAMHQEWYDKDSQSSVLRLRMIPFCCYLTMWSCASRSAQVEINHVGILCAY